MTMKAPIVVAHGAATDAGLRRALNEDSYLAAAPLFLVADGMGGHAAGEVASAAVIEEFAVLAGAPSVSVEAVHAAFERARERVLGFESGAAAGAGTTLTGVAITELNGDGYWLTINVGDSRTYRLAGGALEQISVDHSWVQELVDSGEMDADAAQRDPRRNVVTRAIGAGSNAEPDFWLLPASVGDRMLVCSDGLPGELSAPRIARILSEERAPQDAATRLVHEAMLHGGRDNVTVVVVDALAVVGDMDDIFDTLPGAGEELPDEDTVPRGGIANGGVR